MDSAFHARVLESLRHPVAVLDSDDRVIWCNRAMAALAGLDDPERAVGRAWGELVESARTEPWLDEQALGVTRNGDPLPAAVRIGDRWFDVATDRLDGSGDDPPARIRVLHDVTPLKGLEMVLQASEARYRGLVENALVGVYSTTAGGEITYVNRAFARMLGYDSPETMIRQRAPSRYVHGEDRDRLLQMLDEAGQVDQFETLLLTRDERPVHILLSARRDGEALLGMALDVSERTQAVGQLRHSLDRLRRTLEAAINALALAIEMRDPYTAGHQRRVAQLATAIGTEMGLSDERVNDLRMAGIIHDLGKIHIPAEILAKPGMLGDIEYAMMKTHPQVGADILRTIDFPGPISQIVLQHHERLDGSGYPQGLRGDAILLEARILCVADVFEAMASHRPYRPSLGVQAARDEIVGHRGALYDVDVVDACLRVLDRGDFALT